MWTSSLHFGFQRSCSSRPVLSLAATLTMIWWIAAPLVLRPVHACDDSATRMSKVEQQAVNHLVMQLRLADDRARKKCIQTAYRESSSGGSASQPRCHVVALDFTGALVDDNDMRHVSAFSRLESMSISG